MSVYLKIHENPDARVVAACDSDLIGKVLEDKNGYMNLDKYRGFYVGEIADEEEVKKQLLTQFSSINMVGKKSVGIAVSLGIIQKRDIRYIKNIPYIQVYKI